MARLGLEILQRTKRVGGPGRSKDLMALEMRRTAASVYETLTERKANVAYDPYAGQELETDFVIFLNRVYEAYGVQASAKSRARKRATMTKK